METEKRMVVTSGWGREERERFLMGTEFQICMMKKSGDIHNTVNILNINLYNETWLNGKFDVMCILP